jgi:hypothetical protein
VFSYFGFDCALSAFNISYFVLRSEFNRFDDVVPEAFPVDDSFTDESIIELVCLTAPTVNHSSSNRYSGGSLNFDSNLSSIK